MNVQHARVTTNSFEVTQLPTAEYPLFEVLFNPPIEKKYWKRKSLLVHHLQATVQPAAFPFKVLYDGGAIAFVHERTRAVLGPQRTFLVRLGDDNVPPRDARGAVEIQFRMTQGESIKATDLNQFILGNNSQNRSSVLNFLQLVIRQASNNMHPNNGRAYFGDFPTTATDRRDRRAVLPSKLVASALELRRGVFHSVRPALNKVTVVIDTVVAAFYQSGSLIDCLMSFFGFRDIRDLQKLNKRQLLIARKFFKGVIITQKKGVATRPGSKRKIKGFDEKGADYEFENDQGVNVSIADHYFRVHGIKIRHRTIPGVVLREKPRMEIVPMETCFVEPGQLFKKALPESVTRDMVGFATLGPDQKLPLISRAAEHYQASESVTEAGMRVSTTPMVVDASFMTPPQIKFGDSAITVRDGKWNVVGRRLLERVDFCHWAVVNLAGTQISFDVLQRQISTFRTCAGSLGIPLGNPIHTMATDPNQGGENLINHLNQFMSEVMQKAGDIGTRMLEARRFFILFVLEASAAGPRAALKYWGDVRAGIITQCVRCDKITGFRDERGASQYWNNVALKINPRLGGVNSSVVGSRAMDHLSKGRTMFVGMDVGHAAPGVKKPSVASMVYNQDPFGIKYEALTRIQDPRQEVIVDLENMFRLALLDIMRIARGAMNNIIIFRDGVSEGEYDRIEQQEIAAIRRAIDNVWTTHPKIREGEKGQPIPKPKLSFIVVGKRHHSLLFPNSPQINDGKGNCKAGVVVNRGITQPHLQDFYLQSHAAIIGTSRSSHYIVLLNEVFDNHTPSLEELAYALCHVYAKATRSVSIPAPVYYADLVCSRDAFHFAPDVQERLRASDTGSVTSGGEAPFNLDVWTSAFEPRHMRLQGNMYFL